MGTGRLGRALGVYRDRRFAIIFGLGMASGLPTSLVFATLSIWLREEGLTRTTIGLFGAVATPYAINFLWAPLLDHTRIPWLGNLLGRRRSWIVAMQVLLALAIGSMALTDPVDSPLLLALAALALAFVSATQDVAIDAYRVEILDEKTYGAGSAVAVLGWHLGAFASGAGALYLASFLSWSAAYLGAAALILLLIGVSLAAREPEAEPTPPAADVGTWLRQAVVAPFAEFFGRLKALAVVVIAFIVFYKFGDAMLGRMAGVFYVDLAFTKVEIANYSKSVGLIATLLGVVAGGALCARVSIMTALFAGGIAMASTNLLFALLAWTGKDYTLLAGAVFLDNLTAGLATSAFVAYLSSLCNRAFTATQYALLASTGNFARIQLGAVAGWTVDAMGGDWAAFFILTTVAALPGLLLLYFLMRRTEPGRIE